MAAAVVERHDTPAIPAVKHYRLLEDRAREPAVDQFVVHAATYQQLVETCPSSPRSLLQRSVTMGWAMIHRLLIV